MRTFVAVEIPTTIRTSIAPMVQTLRDHLRAAQLDRSVRWVQPSKLHLTLRFLGETTPDQRNAVTADLASAVRGQPSFQLSIADLGCFPNMNSPRVVWLGLAGDLGDLGRLQARVEASVQRAGYGPDSRSFSPHLTIGRVQRGLSKPDQQMLGAGLKSAHKEVLAMLAERESALSFEARELVLMRSELKPEGAEYTVLERFRLK